MRYFLLSALIVGCHCSSIAQHIPTGEENVKWLHERLSRDNSIGVRAAKQQYGTSFCVVNEKISQRELVPKDFTSNIVTYLSWKGDELHIQNDIFKSGKLIESYTYQVPSKAIVSAHLTNCQRNSLGFVNAYTDRPVFIRVKKNTTRVGYTTIIANGQKIVSTTEEYHINSKDYDWESVIPIAGKWDRQPALRDSVVAALGQIGDLNKQKRVAKYSPTHDLH